jgi:hypothetical protein
LEERQLALACHAGALCWATHLEIRMDASQIPPAAKPRHQEFL